ncbi:MAG: hypothetical protein EOO36_00235 [Cytophagaceae bacterium]|nr:MAG: hypothetical protein EOO36_00235 [Cytophagaceae bacterium]
MRTILSCEVLIIGGSYAGFSAALALGRARRSVLVLDAQRLRNRTTPHAPRPQPAAARRHGTRRTSRPRPPASGSLPQP